MADTSEVVIHRQDYAHNPEKAEQCGRAVDRVLNSPRDELVHIRTRLKKGLSEAEIAEVAATYVSPGMTVRDYLNFLLSSGEAVESEGLVRLRTERRYCPAVVDTLGSDEVFVFGSNHGGFHGAGAAGWAMRGTTANTWRQDAKFVRALQAPDGHEDKKGRWAVLGVGRGYQVGTEGRSYAIQTVTRPGALRSVPLNEILHQLRWELAPFARTNYYLTFYVVVGGGGYNGYSVAEFQEMYKLWCTEPGYDRPPDNILLKREYEFRV